MWDNRFDLGTLTASSQNALFPVSNVKHRWPTRAWRSTAVASPEWILCDLGAAYPVTAIGVRYTNLSAGSGLQVAGSNPGGGPSYTQAMAPSAAISVLFPGIAENYEKWEFIFTDTANPAGYIAAGRLFVGPYFEPSISPIDEYDEPNLDPSTASFSEGGQTSSIQRAKYNVRQYRFMALTAADIASFKLMWASRGNFLDLWVCEEPAYPMTTSYYGRIKNTFQPKHVRGTDLYELALEIEEMR